MKSLPEIIHKNGFIYHQVLRGIKSCIYEQGYTESVKYFEVFLIKVKPERIFKGKAIEAREAFPHDEAFGLWAWSYRDYNKAYQKYLELEKE